MLFYHREERSKSVKTQPNHFVVAAEALPEIVLRVSQAKDLLETGEAETVNDAVKRVGVSRSAFYKYKDLIHPFSDLLSGRIVTFQAVLRHEPGALSALLDRLAQGGANLLTINQGIPSGGVAVVTFGVETSALTTSLEELLKEIETLKSVIHCEVLAG